MRAIFFCLPFLFFVGCQKMTADQAKKRIKAQNTVKERIVCSSKTQLLPQFERRPYVRARYEWELRYEKKYYPITKEHFRCKGSGASPIKRVVQYGQEVNVTDCRGIHEHSLPLKNEKEWIFPLFIELLNFIQNTIEKKVIVTCGHRCPTHNLYADDSKINQTSKHQVGAEVDFYVEGLEYEPWKVVDAIRLFYKEHPTYKGISLFEEFSLISTNKYGLSHKGLCNKEIEVRVVEANEGRDGDNAHPYPYITIELRYDRDTKKSVHFNWHAAHYNFLRK